MDNFIVRGASRRAPADIEDVFRVTVDADIVPGSLYCSRRVDKECGAHHPHVFPAGHFLFPPHAIEIANLPVGIAEELNGETMPFDKPGVRAFTVGADPDDRGIQFPEF
jgi:hypothetical protein